MTKKNNTPATSAAAFVVTNGVKVNVAVHDLTLATVLKELVAASRREQGAQIRIAAKLNDLMEFDWFDVDNAEVSNEAAMLKPHKEALYAALKEAGHANPSVVWSRLRDYGRNLRAGLSPNGKTMADGSAKPEGGEGEGTGEGANPAKRSDTLFMVEELTRIYKRAFKSADAKVQATLPHVTGALKAMGVDVRTIKTDNGK